MNFSSKVAKNFMFSRKEVGPSRVTGIIAVVGIAVGTMAMILSVSVLNGFESTALWLEIFANLSNEKTEKL